MGRTPNFLFFTPTPSEVYSYSKPRPASFLKNRAPYSRLYCQFTCKCFQLKSYNYVLQNVYSTFLRIEQYLERLRFVEND